MDISPSWMTFDLFFEVKLNGDDGVVGRVLDFGGAGFGGW